MKRFSAVVFAYNSKKKPLLYLDKVMFETFKYENTSLPKLAFLSGMKTSLFKKCIAT